MIMILCAQPALMEGSILYCLHRPPNIPLHQPNMEEDRPTKIWDLGWSEQAWHFLVSAMEMGIWDYALWI